MLTALFVAFAVVGTAIFGLVIFLTARLLAEAKLGAIFRSGVEGENMTFALTDAYFPKIKCFRKVWLRDPSSGEPFFAEQILVCRGGIFVITSFHEKGRINNPIHDDWTLSNGKQTRVTVNPFFKNYEVLSCIEALAEKVGLPRPIIYSMVVVTETQVLFSETYDLLVPADEFPLCLKRLKRNRFYSSRHIKKYIRLLDDNRVSAPAKAPTKHI